MTDERLKTLTVGQEISTRHGRLIVTEVLGDGVMASRLKRGRYFIPASGIQWPGEKALPGHRYRKADWRGPFASIEHYIYAIGTYDGELIRKPHQASFPLTSDWELVS